MPARPIIERVKRLKARGWRQRDIASRVGVCVGTVGNILSGKYEAIEADAEERRRRIAGWQEHYKHQAEALLEPSRSEPVDGGLTYPEPEAPPVRCPTCGSLVLAACLACQVRRLKRKPR